jgi:class 3 adenylate cyclase
VFVGDTRPVERVRTCYTDGRDPALAYQVAGPGGGVDVVAIQPPVSHVEHTCTYPSVARVMTRLAGLGRLIRFDRRSVGLSDPGPGAYTIADEVDDVVAVMDAAGVERAAVVSWTVGGPVACLLAALHPERVGWLILDTCVVRQTYAPDYPWAPTEDERAAMFAGSGLAWGEGDFHAMTCPDWAAQPGARAWMGTMERFAVGPATMRRLRDYMNATDVRAALPSIRAPTLVLRRRDDEHMDRRHSVFVAEHIEGAQFEELEGRDAIPFGARVDDAVDLIGRFVTGRPPPAPPTRGLVTLLFTDIVDSTAILARVGDTRWRETLERHDAAATAVINGAGGRVIKSLGDGVFARFGSVPDAVAAGHALIKEAAGLGVAVRAGVHIGDCELVGDDFAGRTVHEAARIAARAGPGELLVADAAHGLLAGSELRTTDTGFHALKGFEEPYRLWTVDATV